MSDTKQTAQSNAPQSNALGLIALMDVKEFLEFLPWCKRHGQPATAARADRCKVHLFALVPECDVVQAGIWEMHVKEEAQ